MTQLPQEDGYIICLAAPLLFTAGAALAGGATGAACGSHLSPPVRQIDGAAAPHLLPSPRIADLSRATVRSMVMPGQISLSSARPAAEAAAKCLVALRHQTMTRSRWSGHDLQRID